MRARIRRFVVAISSGFLIAIGSSCQSLPALVAPKVKTGDGVVQGFTRNGVTEFLGIPYAAAPVGELRWQPPQAHVPWTSTLSASDFGPACAQVTTLGVFAGPGNSNEDCLYLNVFEPTVHLRSKGKLPVMVWIHGGGDFSGESNDYDGSKLALQGHVIVVTFNYRLGLFGWLAHPALDAEGHLFANYGLLDQQFVLRWVKRNIAAFGGDETRVMLAGQSAGSVNTEANVVSPLARGLFQRAIFQSIVEEPVPLPEAEATGSDFAVAAGCGAGATAAIARCLRALSPAQVLALSGTESEAAPYLTGPIADGRIIPSHGFLAAFRQGSFNHMPVMSGTTSDEANFKLAVKDYFSGPPRVPPTEVDFNTYVTSTFGRESHTYPPGTEEKVFAHYSVSAYASPQFAMDAVRTDFLACSQRKLNRVLAQQVPVYAYEFQDRTAPFYFPELPQFQALAYHTADLQYLFPGWHGGPRGIRHSLNAEQEKLSDQMVTAWANFARTGDPNGRGNWLWPRYESQPGKSAYYEAQKIPGFSTFPDDQFSAGHHCDFWESILVP